MNGNTVHHVGDIEFGVTEAISLPGLVTSSVAELGLGNTLRSGAKFIKSVSGANKGSIAKMARDYVMQFPVIASSSIPEEDLFAITKNFEIQYAQFVSMILQGVTGINVRDIDSTSDILKQIHSNEDAPNLLDYALDITGGRNTSMESFTVGIPKSELDALAYGTDEEFTMENLNSMYQPNKRNLDKYERIIGTMEGKGSNSDSKPTPSPDPNDDPLNWDDTEMKVRTNAAKYNKLKQDTAIGDANLRKLKRDADLTDIRIKQAKVQDRKTESDFRTATLQRKKLAGDISKNATVSVSDLNKIQNTGEAPTVLTATLYLESQSGAPEARTLIFGVKTMVRQIPSTVMIPNVVDCIASNTWAFRFVKWTKGETKFFRDIVFDISNARKEAINDNDPAGAWFNSVKRRKRNSKWFGSKTNISPVMTLIITDAEAEAIKAQTGIDLMDDKAASKLLKDMYLLGFAIYHTANGNVDIMLDKYSNGRFYSTTMTGLRASNRGNSTTDLREINKLLQNGGYIR